MSNNSGPQVCPYLGILEGPEPSADRTQGPTEGLTVPHSIKHKNRIHKHFNLHWCCNQDNAEIAERQSELERLKQLYTEKVNADIQFALKAVAGQGVNCIVSIEFFNSAKIFSKLR